MRSLLISVALVIPGICAAQTVTGAAAAAGYMDRYRELQSLAPVPGKVAEVNHLVLTRDVAQLTLEHGQLYFLSPVGGRTVGAVFRGSGAFSFAPPVPAEQAELQRFGGNPLLSDSLTEVVLLFADSTTPRQLAALPGIRGDPPTDLAGHVRDLVESLRGDNEGAYNEEVIGPILNGDTTGLFLAHIERTHGGPVLFKIDPTANEAVQLYRPVNKARWGGNWAVVTEFPPQNQQAGAGAWWYRKRLTVPSYRIDIHLTPTGSANLDYAAAASLSMKAEEPIGPWLLFALHPKLLVDSARWTGGDAASVFNA